MKGVLVMAICAWWTTIFTVVVLATSVTSSSIIDQTLSLNPVTFDLKNADAGSYSEFLDTLRNKLKDSNKVCKLPTLQKSITGYLKVDLIVGTGETITLAIEAKNLYLRAYKNNNQGIVRRFEDSDATSLKTLFNAETKGVGFKGNYDDLERIAKISGGGGRENLQLGLLTLHSFAQTIYKKGPLVDSVAEARFFIIALQMVSEAARFKYIENLVKDTAYTSVLPDAKMLDLEKNWEKISLAIFKSSKDATKSCTSMPEVKIGGERITTIEAIAPYIGIILYQSIEQEEYYLTGTLKGLTVL